MVEWVACKILHGGARKGFHFSSLDVGVRKGLWLSYAQASYPFMSVLKMSILPIY